MPFGIKPAYDEAWAWCSLQRSAHLLSAAAPDTGCGTPPYNLTTTSYSEPSLPFGIKHYKKANIPKIRTTTTHLAKQIHVSDHHLPSEWTPPMPRQDRQPSWFHATTKCNPIQCNPWEYSESCYAGRCRSNATHTVNNQLELQGERNSRGTLPP